MKKVQDLIKKFGFIVIVFSVFIMTLTSSKVQAAEVTITRAQWLHDLTQLFGITVEQDDYPDNYFNDIDSLPTASALCQQRDKLDIGAFQRIVHLFVNAFDDYKTSYSKTLIVVFVRLQKINIKGLIGSRNI